MPQATLSQRDKRNPSRSSYSELLRDIRKTIQAGKVRATQAVEQELVRTKWETGKLILEHILLNKDRADYGKQVIKRLSKDLNTSVPELDFMVAFARENPIYSHASKLTWDKERELLSVNEVKERADLAVKASQQKWTRETLRKEIKKLKKSKQITVTPEPKPAKLPNLKPGQLGLFSIFKLGGKTYRDLGFSVWQEVKGIKVTNTKASELYTYEAQVTKVFDGDTFHALIHLKDDIYLEQRVRLRRLDAPEIITAAGQQAKKVLERVLSSSVKRGRTKEGASATADKQPILIKVSKTDDQYGRYLVDVWVDGANIDQELLDSGVFTVRE